ncbi:MAG: hypothetical protein ACE5SW_10315 [Nitrososphaeraceae archaeon]
MIGNWSTGVDSFAVDVPNVILVINESERQRDDVIIELFNRVYDSDKNALKYQINLANSTSLELPKKF